MNSAHKNILLVSALIAGLGVIPAGRVAAQAFTTLHFFNGVSDGGAAGPSGDFVLASNRLYGVCNTVSNGAVFAMNTDGTGFTNLHSFAGPPAEGAGPSPGLVLSGNTLYGTTQVGGSSNCGTVFAINTDGTGFTNLHSFAGPPGEGKGLNGNLLLSSGTLYGTTQYGGNSGTGTVAFTTGTVFSINTNGTGFTNFYSFSLETNGANSDGMNPNGGLVLASNTLYGTTINGGTWGNGVVFAMNTNGSNFTALHYFTPAPDPFTNSDGTMPVAGLLLSGGVLYGTAASAGAEGNFGTIFAINTDGSGFTNLHSFSLTDGSQPECELTLFGSILFGTTSGGGGGGNNGTIFAIHTNGSGFGTLHILKRSLDGAEPVNGLALSGYALYGAAAFGGTSNSGTVFSLSFAPQLTITRSGTNVVLSWPTKVDGFDYSGFTLQSTTNLGPATAWKTVAPPSMLVNGRFTETNPISGTAQFYRLILEPIPAGLALIPAGAFTMGNSIGDSDITDANPTNVTVSAFYMDVNLVTSNQWRSVYSYATNHGYGFADAGLGKGSNHPVYTVDWYDAVKWCNARSQQGGLVPVYYTDAGLTQVFTNGESATTIYAGWGANGYRLPTEAEWEKAARGGLSGQRFPWGDTISEGQANYFACSNGCGFTYDTSPYGYNPNFDTGPLPYTSPVGYFSANGYGLYDMAGNVYEWCWDWYAAPPFPAGSPYLGGSDPRGPASGSSRVLRGGYWNYYATDARCAYRGTIGGPNVANDIIGFRCVRGP